MAQKLTIDINIDNNGRASVAGVRGGSGGQGAASASAARESSRGGSGGSDFASQIAGKPVYGGGGSGIPFFLDPTNTLGSAARFSLDAAMNPFLSGGQQDAIFKSQAARASTYAGIGAVSAGISAIPGMSGAAEKLDQIGKALADTVATAFERGLQKQSMTSGAAVQSVSGIVDQYSSAGISLSDAQIKKMLEQEQARQVRLYEGRERVAKASGNETGSDATKFLTDKIKDLEEQLGALRNVPGVQKSLDDARLVAEQQLKGLQAHNGHR